MNLIEAAKLLTVSSALTGREPTEEQAIAWATVLDDIPLIEALDGMREHYRVSRFPVMPADILEHVEAARANLDRDRRRARSLQRRRAENADHRQRMVDGGRQLRDDDVLWPGIGWTGDGQSDDSLTTSIPVVTIASRSA